MAFSVVAGIPVDKDPADDVVNKSKAAAWNRTDPTGEYYSEEVGVGQGKPKVKLKIAYDEPFAYAVYAENPQYLDLETSEWQAKAVLALEKFAATKNLQIKQAPMPEFGTRYNFRVEFNKPASVRQETQAALDAHAAQMAKRKADREKRNEMLRLLSEGARL